MSNRRTYYAYVPKIKTLQQALAENVTAVMEKKSLSQPKVAAAAKRAGAQIDQRTVGRIKNGEFPCTVETLEALAKGLGELPWQLLIPEGRDEKFLAILKAWSQADDEGRRVLSTVAGAIGQKDQTAGDGTEPRRASDAAAERR